MIQRILVLAFHTLFFVTPLIFTPFNHELFEYNKMMLVYFLATIVTFVWVLKMLQSRSLIIKKTPLDLPLGIFLISQSFSTVFSIDPHTSVWGYYTRSNGGLLSIISYVLLYYAFISNFSFKQALQFLKTALWGGLIVSLWAIPEHFGFSPSCAILVNKISADCWVQDVQARVFATLGQPNWLAAYLGMLIFPVMYFALTVKTIQERTVYFLLLTVYYLAFTFTYSRGGSLGFLGGLVVFILGYTLGHFWRQKLKGMLNQLNLIRPLLLLVCLFLFINLLFGSSLTGDFRLIKKAAPPPRPGISLSPTGTQLESDGSESGQIRLIVWRGALDIFKAYPILGSGVETFAYSYYNFRPQEHNKTTEWDFLYNKAHNEYLNYLATTGLVGFISYLAVILTFIVWLIKISISYKLKIRNKSQDFNFLILNASLLAGYVSYLIQNFFGFSVVVIALLFYLFPAFAFLKAEESGFKLRRGYIFLDQVLIFFHQLGLGFIKIIYKRALNLKLFKGLMVLIFILINFTLIKYWVADTAFKNGGDFADLGNPGKAYNNFTTAVELNPGEPLYHSELGFAAASAAVALLETDATRSALLKDEADYETRLALDISPKNVSLWRTAIRTYFQLSIVDPQYNQRTLEVIDKTIQLAPTDPKILYNLGVVLGQYEDREQAIEAIKKALELKPDYKEAIDSLEELR